MYKMKCLCGKEIVFNDKYIPEGQKTEIHCLDCGAVIFFKKPNTAIFKDKNAQ